MKCNIDLQNRYFEYQLLEHVEKTPRLTARIATAKLGCSIRLTHALLKKMVERGSLHVKKINSRRWDYYLTPQGVAEKARLTYEFINFSMHFYQEARKSSSQLCRDLKGNGINRISIFGAGDLAEIVYLGIKEWELELVEVYDDHATEFIGRKVKPVSEIANARIKDVIDCTYDPQNPMAPGHIPDCEDASIIFHNVFGEVEQKK
jgi:predicted transcriptional regulator